MKVLIGTNNLHKLEEFRQIFKAENIDIQILSLKDMPFQVEDPVEDGNSFSDNALIKAKYFYNAYKIPCISDDSGVVVDALNGMPGIYTARYAKLHGMDQTSANNRKVLLENMEGKENRKAHFECNLTYYDGNTIISATGIMNGEISKEEYGTNGFGYDPIFYLPEYEKTVAELDEKVKNKLSHRYNAIMNFINKFKTYKNC